jgi:hypothetical protein
VPNSISTELAGFLESGISVLVGSRDARSCPRSRARSGPESFLAGTSSSSTSRSRRPRARSRTRGERAPGGLLLAVDHRSYQVKGRLVEVLDAGDEDRRRIETYRAGLAQHYGFVGMPPKLTYRIAHWPAHAVRIAVEAIFLQTPAGSRRALGCRDAEAPEPRSQRNRGATERWSHGTRSHRN